MRLEKKKDEEIAARKGMTGKTIIAFIWLAISAVMAYFFVDYLFASGILSHGTFYGAGIPRSIPDWVITGVLVLLVVAFMQTFLLFGFILASPEGRRKTGDPTLYSRSSNQFDEFDGGRG